jgi:hypothetical protein
MTRQSLRKAVILLSVTFIWICLAGEMAVAEKDTTLAEIEIRANTVYPGHFGKFGVYLKNSVPISGFSLLITISNPELLNFHTDSISIENIIMRVDTCTWQPDSLHDSTCYKDSLVPTPIRNCYIDTVGSLISGFQWVNCEGDTDDISKPDCKWIQVFGMAYHGSSIAANPNWQLLFRFGVDAFCIPDSTTERNCSFYMVPQGNSFLSNPLGEVVPFAYDFGTGGQFMSWYSTPGDANGDSVINVGDITFMINYLFKRGPKSCIPEAADANASCLPEVGDITTLINYLFKHGAAPLPGCWFGK